MSACFLSNMATASGWPRYAAMINGVNPDWLRAFTVSGTSVASCSIRATFPVRAHSNTSCAFKNEPNNSDIATLASFTRIILSVDLLKSTVVYPAAHIYRQHVDPGRPLRHIDRQPRACPVHRHAHHPARNIRQLHV